MLIRLFQQFGFGFGMDMLEGFGMVKFFLGILKGGGELGKIIGKVLDCRSFQMLELGARKERQQGLNP